MAKIKQGILGGFSGTVGPVIGGSWKGIQYLRAKPHKYPVIPTKKQSVHFNKFGAGISLAKSVKNTIIKPIWNQKAVKMSGFNLFVKTNKDVFDETGAVYDFPNLKFSVGDLPLPENIAVANDVTGNGAIVITWNNNTAIAIAAPTDLLRVVVLNRNEPVVLNGLTFTRNAGSATIQLPYGAGETVHLYIFFEDETNKIYSNSFHSSLNIT
jgi:hypothetical protein